MAITLPRVAHKGNGQTTYSGTFSHTVGTAAETFALGSARVLSIEIANLDTKGPVEIVSFSESISGSTNTVTVNRAGGVTTGRIIVETYAGS